jgi:hypothetical protein
MASQRPSFSLRLEGPFFHAIQVSCTCILERLGHGKHSQSCEAAIEPVQPWYNHLQVGGAAVDRRIGGQAALLLSAVGSQLSPGPNPCRRQEVKTTRSSLCTRRESDRAHATTAACAARKAQQGRLRHHIWHVAERWAGATRPCPGFERGEG